MKLELQMQTTNTNIAQRFIFKKWVFTVSPHNKKVETRNVSELVALRLYFSKNFQTMSQILETIGPQNKINTACANKQQYYWCQCDLFLIKTQWFDKKVDIVKKRFEKYKLRPLYS